MKRRRLAAASKQPTLMISRRSRSLKSESAAEVESAVESVADATQTLEAEDADGESDSVESDGDSSADEPEDSSE